MVAYMSSRSALLFAHVFEKYVGFVEEANLLDHLVPPGGPHFAHMFENGAKLATRTTARCTRVRKRSKVATWA